MVHSVNSLLLRRPLAALLASILAAGMLAGSAMAPAQAATGGQLGVPFGLPDDSFRVPSFTDAAPGGLGDIAGGSYGFSFANVGNTPTGRVTNIDLAGGTGSMLLYFDDATGQYSPVSTAVLRATDAGRFSLSSFRIQDAQAIGSLYTATGYLDDAPVTGAAQTFTTGGSWNPVTITLTSAFAAVDEVRITSNGGAGGVGAKLWQEGFNNFAITPVFSHNSDLAALAVDGGALAPGFAAATTGYTVAVPFSAASTRVTPRVADATATVKVNGTPIASGSPSQAIALSVGNTTITTLVTAQDGTTKTYTITVERAAPATDSTLSALSLSSGTLSPAFAGGVSGYTAAVDNATTTVTVTPTTTSGNAVVTVDGIAVASGSASQAIAVPVGDTTVTTRVTAEDGTVSAYTVRITRAAPMSTVAELDSLTVSGATLAPAFARTTTGYTSSVDNATTAVTVTAVLTDPTASIVVAGENVASGAASAPIALRVGTTTVTAVVTAQDGTTSKTYTVSVTRAPSHDAGLASLILSSGTLAPAFTTGTTNYTASVDHSVTSIAVAPKAVDAAATVTVDGVPVPRGTASATMALAVGVTTIAVIVTAEDATTTSSYTLRLTRAAAPVVVVPDPTTPIGPRVTLAPVFTVGSSVSGAAVELSAVGLSPGSAVTLTMFSTPVVLFSGAARADGSVAATATLPTVFEPGAHRLVLDAIAADGTTVSRTVWFSVLQNGTIGAVSEVGPVGVLRAAAPTATARPGALAQTGADTSAQGLGGVLLLALGTLAVALSRRRTAGRA
jgi:hypothetical protein